MHDLKAEFYSICEKCHREIPWQDIETCDDCWEIYCRDCVIPSKHDCEACIPISEKEIEEVRQAVGIAVFEEFSPPQQPDPYRRMLEKMRRNVNVQGNC